ncbi:MAG: hypothetical protein NTX03_07500 [Bacteroidetes bacterium]|nr:hypothetical protein [Bacteroidota bacterium]
MGLIIKANCTLCNFSKQFSYGGDMMNHFIWNGVPAIHKNTGEFIVENYIMREELKDKLNFYTEPQIFLGEKEEFGLQHGDIMLNRKWNKCPAYKEFSLDFVRRGFWD